MDNGTEQVENATERVDAVVVGAGFSGLYMLHSLLRQGMSARLYEAAPDVGGTWYWNRYPGARCDVESIDYSYSFDDALQQEWEWSERYPAQPEILRYLRHVADRFGLRRHIVLDTRVTSAHFDPGRSTWTVRSEGGSTVVSSFCVMAVGCLSAPKQPDLTGIDDFAGDLYHTARWPKTAVDFTGKRVGLVGTGSSGVQVAPELACQAAELTVFQRTPAFCSPARNRPLSPSALRAAKATYPQRREANRNSQVGVVRDDNPASALDASPRDRLRTYAEHWERGGFALLGAYGDLMLDQQANDTVADFVRQKIREAVADPDVARQLLPWEYPLGAKRICLEDGYYDMFNRDNVTVVDLRTTPLEAVTRDGVRTSAGVHPLDCLVLATGFDAMTGALAGIDIRGRGGLALAETWQQGPRTYLGLAAAGFPNLFLLTGPGSPSVLTNMVTSIEQHVEWVAACLHHLRSQGYANVEATGEAAEAWTDHVDEVAAATLFPKADSWYTGANVAGKTRMFMPYAGGFATYRQRCEEVAAQGYQGFDFRRTPYGVDSPR
ncbi:NAD(P)/FAD-dependent oxidoreductase [Streptomyces sp. NPDC048484]|uniref:flavin-containing monooxygenase n=1 Tax=Streptomyces sp. NPDC048484 TaxID=3155146 RepID=UPI003444CBEC